MKERTNKKELWCRDKMHSQVSELSSLAQFHYNVQQAT